jgi:hypothetical protein
MRERGHMGLSAHLEGLMNGMFLAVLGLVWQWLVLSPRASFILFALALYGAYANWFTTLLAAILGTSRRTPIAGSGFRSIKSPVVARTVRRPDRWRRAPAYTSSIRTWYM